MEEQVKWKVMMKLAKKMLVTVLLRFNQCFPLVGGGAYHAACGIFPHQGLNLCPLHWKFGVLTTGPAGKSQSILFKDFIFSF